MTFIFWVNTDKFKQESIKLKRIRKKYITFGSKQSFSCKSPHWDYKSAPVKYVCTFKNI